MATLRDVAKLSGVSPATVSHVLHNRTRNMTPETRQRVLQAVRTLNYRPGALPKTGDAERTTHTIGVFVWLAPGYPLRDNPYASDVLDGILNVSLNRHWNVMLFNVTAWDDAHSQLRQYADGRCDGFILVAPPPSIGIPDALRERGYPFTLVNSGSNDYGVNSVDIDNRAAARELTNYLIQQGHRHLGFLPGAEDYENTNERIEGFREAISAAGLPDPSEWILRPGSYDYNQSRERVMEMIDRRAHIPEPERLTALICGNDKLASCASEALHERGIRIPDDISLAGFDDTRYGRTMNPPLTTVHQPLHEIGGRATEILLELIQGAPNNDGPTNPAIKELLPHRILYRESVREI